MGEGKHGSKGSRASHMQRLATMLQQQLQAAWRAVAQLARSSNWWQPHANQWWTNPCIALSRFDVHHSPMCLVEAPINYKCQTYYIM